MVLYITMPPPKWLEPVNSQKTQSIMEKNIGSTLTKTISITEIKQNSGMKYNFFHSFFLKHFPIYFLMMHHLFCFPNLTREEGCSNEKNLYFKKRLCPVLEKKNSRKSRSVSIRNFYYWDFENKIIKSLWSAQPGIQHLYFQVCAFTRYINWGAA